MATLNVEHNLSEQELKKAIIGLTVSGGLEGEVMEVLTKACTCDEAGKEPRAPAMKGLFYLFRREYAKATEWILQYVDEVLSEPMQKAEGFLCRPLTANEIKQVQTAIRERFHYILAQMAPDQYQVTDDVLNRWKALGIIDRTVTPATFAMSVTTEGQLIHNAFLFGKLLESVEDGQTFDEVMKAAKELPLLKPDLNAIAVAEQQTGNYISAFGDDLAKEFGQLATAQNRDIVQKMAVDFHSKKLHATDATGEETSQLVETWQGFSSELAGKFNDYERDWDRIAFFEINDAKGQGRGLDLMEKHGTGAIVYKMPLPTACPQCRYLYMMPDGTPRLFKLSEMLSWGNNIGRKPLPVKGGVVADNMRTDGTEPLKPVSGQVHPFCQCTGPHLFTGHEVWAGKHQGEPV